MPSRPPPPPHIRGFTLIELLVALLVLGVALLGLAGLQSVAVQENRTALLRTQATVAAQEMLDRMRANRTEALKPGAPYQTALTQPASTYTPCNSNCATTAVVGNDLYRWKLGLQQQLPNGQGAISRPATNLFEV
ncbi:MAG TPA: type IV pilus modification protein PilV, partial [Pseudomonadales bacterium]|nr:type IV pilus modification protein PilV [Pseudomonadales bacterium]